MTEVSYDLLIQEFIDARVTSDSAVWKQAAIAFYLKERMNATGKQIASDTGYSGSYISQLIKTFTAFPEETDRAQDMSFSIHMVCAGEEDPKSWLDLAVAEAWSVRQLKNAISEGKPEKSSLEVAQVIWDKLEMMLERDDEGSKWLRLKLSDLQLSRI